MGYRLAADALVVVHCGFVLFVAAGGLLVLWRPRVAWAHLPAALWGAWIELAGGVCPLTPLENRWRLLGGEAGYGGGFIDHYVMPVLYPPGLTRGGQVTLGLLVVAVNLVFYALAFRRHRANFRRDV